MKNIIKKNVENQRERLLPLYSQYFVRILFRLEEITFFHWQNSLITTIEPMTLYINKVNLGVAYKTKII